MTWRKSTASGDADCCVWVDIMPNVVRVTSTRSLYQLRFTHPEWAAFLTGAKAGEFDLEADRA